MSPSASDVSVITINWNGQPHLSHLIPSLIPLESKEIIVVVASFKWPHVDRIAIVSGDLMASVIDDQCAF